MANTTIEESHLRASTIDMSVIESLRSDLGEAASELLPELIADYLGESRTVLAQLGDAQVEGQLPTVRERAHKLIAPARSFGAMTFADLARQIEVAAGAGDAERVRGLWAVLEPAFAGIERTLRDLKV